MKSSSTPDQRTVPESGVTVRTEGAASTTSSVAPTPATPLAPQVRCSGCHRFKVRNGVWEKRVVEIESADISHGLCPDCVRELEQAAQKFDQLLKQLT